MRRQVRLVSHSLAGGLRKTKSPHVCGPFLFGAKGGIRTPTLLRAPAPQAGASASSATFARVKRRAISSPVPSRAPSPGLRQARERVTAVPASQPELPLQALELRSPALALVSVP